MSMKSSAKSLYSSLQLTVSMSYISSTVTSGVKAIKHGVKHIKKGANTIIWPLKHAKHRLSNISTPVISSTEDNPTAAADSTSITTNNSLEVIEVTSDDKDLDALRNSVCLLSFFFLQTLSLISMLSSCAENLEVPPIFILQAWHNCSGAQWPCRPLLCTMW
jgi:hypothetical protein